MNCFFNLKFLLSLFYQINFIILFFVNNILNFIIINNLPKLTFSIQIKKLSIKNNTVSTVISLLDIKSEMKNDYIKNIKATNKSIGTIYVFLYPKYININ